MLLPLLALPTRPTVPAVFNLFVPLTKHVTSDVSVAEHALGVKFLDEAHKLVEVRVLGAKLNRGEGVRLRPVRPARIGSDDGDKAREVAAIGDRKTVRSEQDNRKDVC